MSTVAALLYCFELLWYIAWKQIRSKLKVAEDIRGLKKQENRMCRNATLLYLQHLVHTNS